ncbi:hypothetical protein VTN00DRAFT_3721 [Thermoascus crustaceus]|uniref:uncharacterized protein n=1 Tax=Thermoascus crustaceus TaxID=5088 RepID=UPI0037441866
MEGEHGSQSSQATYRPPSTQPSEGAGAHSEAPDSVRQTTSQHGNESQGYDSEIRLPDNDIQDENGLDNQLSLNKTNSDTSHNVPDGDEESEVKDSDAEESDRRELDEYEFENEESDEEKYYEEHSDEEYSDIDDPWCDPESDSDSDGNSHSPYYIAGAKYIEWCDPLTYRCLHPWELPRFDQNGVRRTRIIPFDESVLEGDAAEFIFEIEPRNTPWIINLWAVERIQNSRDEDSKEKCPNPPGSSPFERASAAMPAVMTMMQHFNQRDVNAIRETSRTMRGLWPARLIGNSVRCDMVRPMSRFLESIDGELRAMQGPRLRCSADSKSNLIILPCEGYKYGLAKHGPDFHICQECHVSTLFDLRQAQHYVFGPNMRSRICGTYYEEMFLYERTWTIENCKCQNDILNSRLCWDCRRTLIRRAWKRNEIRRHTRYILKRFPPGKLDQEKQSTVNTWLQGPEACATCRTTVEAAWARKIGDEPKLGESDGDNDNESCEYDEIETCGLSREESMALHVEDRPEEVFDALQRSPLNRYDFDYWDETDNPFEDGTFLEQLSEYHRDDRLARLMKFRCGTCNGVSFDFDEFLRSCYFTGDPYYDDPESDPSLVEDMYVCLACYGPLMSKMWPRYLRRKQQENKC